ncbi:hypothetical protein BC831DRAFT_549534 [Entophlyctis helioformis]|nr:hypothetical protein BC831DRAFT_549534 [Entophlyctis helioformis]
MASLYNVFKGVVPPVALALGMNAAAFAVSAPLQTEKFYDLTGSSSFLACTLLGLYNATAVAGASSSLFARLVSAHPRQLLLSAAVSVWAVRLGSFLWYRVHALDGDRRFNEIKKNPKRFAAVFLIQAVWTTMTALPVFMVLATPAASMRPLGALDFIGLAAWAVGFAIETTADFQKLFWQIRHGSKRTNMINNTGIWKYARYPNYFGEILLWSGVALSSIAANDLSTVSGWVSSAFMALSPLFVSSLLLGLSGVPLQEKMALKRFENNRAEYDDYVASTNKFVPWFPRKSALKKE